MIINDIVQDKKHTLRSFAAHSDWVKAVHFADPPPKGDGISTAPKLRPQSLPQYFLPPQEPSVEEVEAEFWRILESPDAPNVESLYGQDLDRYVVVYRLFEKFLNRHIHDKLLNVFYSILTAVVTMAVVSLYQNGVAASWSNISFQLVAPKEG